MDSLTELDAAIIADERGWEYLPACDEGVMAAWEADSDSVSDSTPPAPRKPRKPRVKPPALDGDGEDIPILLKYRNLSASMTPDNHRTVLAKLQALEQQASPAALHWLTAMPADKMDVELKRWRRAYAVELTCRGYRAFRWIKNRQCYASKPTETGMTEERADAYRYYFRR